MENQERLPEELPQEESAGRGLQFPPFNLGKTWSGPQEALDRFNDAVDELAGTFPDIIDRYTTVRGNQLRIVDYRPQREWDSKRYRGWKSRREEETPTRLLRREDYRESQQDQQDPDRRSY